VRASSVNSADWYMTTGRPWAVRLATGLVRPKPFSLGLDVAGVVEAVGPGVTRFGPGDEVYGEIRGAYAEYVAVAESLLARKPSNLTFEQAATVPIAGITALQAMRDKGRVEPGAKVLVNGASGGVGTFAVMIAKAMGAEVTGVCSTRNLELVRSIGADHVVDYTRASFVETRARYDAVLDLVGSAPIRACRRILAEDGVYVSSVGTLGWSLRAFLLSLVPGSNVVVLAAQPTRDDLDALAALIEAGRVTPVVDRRFELGDVPRALRLQGEGHARGKSAILVA
ncbi:MAG: NAD(P)-dependent alcohol dehydrogenase, partial [Polyangiaceae bacterium]|nr:NAD(P)-dependent alcohol dehydrogenase [Polyangiaceae bacterium]